MEKITHVSDEVLKSIKEELEKLKYGSVTVIVHNGKAIQLETSKKTR